MAFCFVNSTAHPSTRPGDLGDIYLGKPDLLSCVSGIWHLKDFLKTLARGWG